VLDLLVSEGSCSINPEVATLFSRRVLQMAEALARGFVSKGVASAENMCCFDPSEERKQVFKEFGVTPCASSKDVVSKGRLIFIAVKPQYVKTVLEEVKGQLSDEHVIVSIAAGVPLSVLEVRPHHPQQCWGRR
jgi:pyrroline-5-carboxylate reductase